MVSKTGYRVRKRGDNYVVDFQIPGSPRFRRSLKTSDPEIAHQRAARIYERISRMVYGGSRQDIRLEEAIQRYLAHGERTREKDSIASDRPRLKNVLDWFPDKIEIRKIGRSDVLEFIAWLRKDKGYSQRTINNNIALAKAAVNLAIADNIYSGDNPFCGKGFIRKIKARPQFYSPVQIEKILEYARKVSESGSSQSQKAFFPFIYMMVNTGMRPKEIFRLRWDHISPQKIDIYRPKSQQDVESIPMLPWVWDFLQAIPKTSLHVLDLKARTTNTFHRIWPQLKKDLKLPEDGTIYWIRHSVASYLADNGVPLHIVQAILRHADWNTTQIYVHSDMARMREALSVMKRFRA